MDERVMSREEGSRIINKIMDMNANPQYKTKISILSWWNGEMRFVRNKISNINERRDIRISIVSLAYGWLGVAVTNQTDDKSLRATLHAAERAAHFSNRKERERISLYPPLLEYPHTTVWSDDTSVQMVEERVSLAESLMAASREQELVASGYIEARLGAAFSYNPELEENPAVRYVNYTQGQCSMTVRHPKGAGSGWAGLASYNWGAINASVLATIALEKCVQSLNPVAIEPGRYTLIMEPQAVHELVAPLVVSLNHRSDPEAGKGPFVLGYEDALDLWRTKLGLKIIDERLTVSHSPIDPVLGILPDHGLDSIVWVKQGVLNALSYNRIYAVEKLNDNLPKLSRRSYHMSGGTDTVEQMISDTARGLLVTRFWGISLLEYNTLLLTGMTRDGLWLIENGKISKAVKNFRFTESPLFALNQVEQLGVPVPVFNPVKSPYDAGLTPVVVPALKVRDFSFTSTVDAI